MTVQEWLGEDNQLGIDIWTKKYQQNNETFDEWLDRISGGNKDIRKLIVEKKFIFGGRILSNRGMDKLGKKITLSNCYVISPPEDNIESIYECATKLARTYSYGGGCGVDISKLSPRGAKINNAAKETTGAVSFMELFDLTTGLIGQNGRRGAMMVSISCDHPDLEEFIELKSDLNKINKANISVRISDKFMEDVIGNRDFILSFTREETGEIISKKVKANDIFYKICKMNWDYAEPGILFWDRITNWNLLSDEPEFEYAGTNPCAEEPLPSGGSCLLGSINLAEFVDKKGKFKSDKFRYTVKTAVEALNEVLDEGMMLHPLQEQRDSVRNWRQIGLGIFGLADMLIKMKVKYGSKQSIDICRRIAKDMINEAVCTSSSLSSEYGSYPKFNYENVSKSKFFNSNLTDFTKNMVKINGLRNSQLLTIAPTGTISTMLGVSGGIEPIFANSYVRKTESLHGHNEYYKVYTPIVKEYMDKNKIDDESKLPDYFVTSKNIEWTGRLDVQNVWQTYVDASISSTINLPENTTIEDIMDIYKAAWNSHIKGITLFREGCMRTGVLTEPDFEKPVTGHSKYRRGDIIKANDDCIGKKRTLHTGCGTLHCQAFFDPSSKELREVYLSKGSTGGCNNFMTGLSRMISLSARGGISIDAIVDQLKSSGTCPSYAVRTATKHDTSKGSSCPVAVGEALLRMYEEMQNDNVCTCETTNDPEEVNSKSVCPECGSDLIFEGGCNTCKNCGYSKCN